MAITVNDILTNLNTNISDASTDRVTAAERLQYATEGVVWLQETLGNDHMNATYVLNYFDTVHYYKVTTSIADLLEGADLRRSETDQYYSFAHKSSQELAEDIGQQSPESAYAIERADNDAYLAVNHQSKYQAKTICGCESTIDGGGTWTVDSTTSDATNLTIDTNEYKEGSGSFNFDVSVSQSVNNRATIRNSTLTSLDLSSYENLSTWLLDIYLPIVTYFSSVTLYWGSSTSNYYSVTSTTDLNGSALAVGWNKMKFDWTSATTTGTPSTTAINYLRIDFNYTASQANNTDYRIDNIKLVRPEKLTFHYLSYNVGSSNTGADITAFTATNDIPFFSGKYDNYKYAVAHKAAANCFRNLRLYNDAAAQDNEAEKALKRISKFIPSSRTPESRSFKPKGISFRRRVRRS